MKKIKSKTCFDDHRTAQHNLEDVCNTILYSENQKEINLAYDIFFTWYKESLIQLNYIVKLSCVEDVLFKILESSAKSEEQLSGKKYSPYSRLVSLAGQQANQQKRTAKILKYSKSSLTYQISDLSKVLMFADVSTDEELNFKNKYLQSIFHKKYILNNHGKNIEHIENYMG